MWSARTNLSIGLNCVTSVNIRPVNSKLRGNTQALFVMTRFNNTRFEFIFTNLVGKSPRLFTSIQAVFQAYGSTRLYRDLKLRGAIISNKELCLLPNEEVYEVSTGIWNLSSDQGNLGSFVITNVRIVWFAALAENFNVSIPYLQVKAITMRNSKFGQALVLETTASSGAYILGFRADPIEKLEEIKKEVVKLWDVYAKNPQFGVEFTVANSEDDEGIAEQEKQTPMPAPTKEDDIEIVDEDPVETSMLYHVDGGPQGASDAVLGDPVYNPELGLAVDRQLKESIAKLWKIG